MKHHRLVPGVSFAALAIAMLAIEARAQEALPAIDVGAARSMPNSGGDPGQGVGTGTGAGNGTDIGAGSNGEICADGLCNDPTSYSAPVESLGTKVNTPVMDTPITTKMITQQMLQDQQVVSIDQALRNVSGVYVNGTGGAGAAVGVSFTGITIRGFGTGAYYRDGVRLDSFQASTLGAGAAGFADIQSVEVLKGPAAILYGAVEPGGIVNLNTKQPLEKPAYSIEQQIGSYSNYRTTLDATGPLSPNKDILYRFNFSYENDKGFQTYNYNRAVAFSPVVKWNIDANTWIKLADNYQENRLNQFFGETLIYNQVVPIWLGRSMNWGPPSPLAQTQNLATLTAHHDFNKDWSYHQTAFWQAQRWQFTNDSPWGLSDCITPGGNCAAWAGATPNTVQTMGAPYFGDGRTAEYATVLDITGHVRTGELEHTLLLGADYYRYNNRIQNLSPQQPWLLTIFGNPVVPPTTWGQNLPFNAGEQYADNVGAYVQDQIKLPYGFHVLAGARYQYINDRASTTDPFNVCLNFSGPFIPCNYDTQSIRAQFVAQRVTPRAALLWRPLEWVSFYGNYVESYSPNYNGLLVLGTNQPNPPSAGEQVEGGVKLQFFDNKLQVQADYYHLVKTNIPVGIPNDYVHEILVGKGRSQGPEFDVGGEPLPGWSINMGYANVNTKVLQTNIFGGNYSPPLGSPIAYIPRNQANISSSYQFKTGTLQGLKVGARYDFADHIPFFPYSVSGTPLWGLPTPGYGIVGCFTSYEFKYNGMTVLTQLNVDNLFDKTFFYSGGPLPIPIDLTVGATPGWQNNFGANTVVGTPRFFRGSVKVSF